ncbi:MAG: alpha/beta fold hydrolase [Rhodoglobus sp.]|nr:alpha/beta fold hydrolase [Rhodoglobus sp.]
MPVDVLWNSAEEPIGTLVLAHGAGGAMDSPWLNEMAALVASRGIRVARFEFAYMAGRRTGTRRAVPKAELVMDEYREVVEQIGGDNLFIGGKSYGGRVASMVADGLLDAGAIRGLVCLGYPFHPPGKPEQLRTAHLTGIRTPTLICQGERDPFGTEAEVRGYELSPAIEVLTFADGDHELKPRKGVTGLTLRDHLTTAADAILRLVE